jgi:4'-phosphopantetheinyl transferase
VSRPVPAGHDVDVWWFDTRAVLPGAAGLAALSGEEQARAATLVFAADRHRYQVAHAMLRQVLGGYLDTAPPELRFGRQPCPRCGGPDGRPVLAPGAAAAAPLPWFSLAHSGDAVAIAVASRPVGVDTEQEPARCVCSLTGSMHPADAAAVAGLTEPDLHAAVIRWWVRAEAVLKCAGEGIAHRLGAFPVLPEATGGPGDGPDCSVSPVPSPAGYQAAVALAGQDGTPSVTLL